MLLFGLYIYVSRSRNGFGNKTQNRDKNSVHFKVLPIRSRFLDFVREISETTRKMWSARQLAIFCVAGTYAGSGDSDCGAFNMYVEPGVEVCADEFCSKLRIECPVGYTSSYDGSIKCKGGVWKGLDVGEVVTCNMDYKMCDYDKLAAVSDDVKTNCDGNVCSYSCKDGSEGRRD